MNDLKGLKASFERGGLPRMRGACLVGPGPYSSGMEALLGEYMERLGTRLHVLETELRYAWRALDMLSQEYVKMWERLEKLEILLYEQQTVIAQLLEFYTSFDIQKHSANKEGPFPVNSDRDQGELRIPDEAFYRSLNNAHRDDLSQGIEHQEQDMSRIWSVDTSKIEGEPLNVKKQAESSSKRGENALHASLHSVLETQEELQEIQQYSSLDNVALSKLKELDILSAKLLEDSQNLKELRERAISSKHSVKASSPRSLAKSEAVVTVSSVPAKLAESVVDEKLKQIYLDSNLEDWRVSPKATESIRSRPNSQLSSDSNATDPEIIAVLSMKSGGSPRHTKKDILIKSSSPLESKEVMHESFKTQEALLPGSHTWNKKSPVSHGHSSSPSLYKSLTEKSPSPQPYPSLGAHQEGSPSAKSASPKEIHRPRTPAQAFHSETIGKRPLTPLQYLTRDPTAICPQSSKPTKTPSPTPLRSQGVLKYDSGISTLNSSRSTSSPIEKSTSPRASRRISPYSSDRFTDQFLFATGLPTSRMSGTSIGLMSTNYSSVLSSLTTVESNSASSPILVKSAALSPSFLPTSTEDSLAKHDILQQQSSTLSFSTTLEDPTYSVERKFPTSPKKQKADSLIITSKFMDNSFSSYSIYPFVSESLTNTQKGKLDVQPLHDDAFSTTTRFPPPPSPAPTSSTYSPYYIGSRASVSTVSFVTNTSLSDSLASNVIGGSIDSQLQVKPYSQLPFYNEPKYTTQAYYNAAGELKFTGQHIKRYDNVSDVDSGKSESRQSYGADSSDSISSYSSSSSFYPSSGPGGKDGNKYTRYPSGSPQIQLNSHVTSRYVPLEDEKKSPSSGRYRQNVNYDTIDNIKEYGYGSPERFVNVYESNKRQFIPNISDQEVLKGARYDETTSYPGLGMMQGMDPSHFQNRGSHDRYGNFRRHTQAVSRSEIPVKPWDGRKSDIHHALDLDKRHSPQLGIEPRQIIQEICPQQAFLDENKVLVSQAGYITISQDLTSGKGRPSRDDKKKVKRVSSMKSALSQVSKIIPNIDLKSKRTRSHSLPSRPEDDDLEKIEKHSTAVSKRKERKKNAFVSTMSGFLRKAQPRGSSFSLPSLSDSEQSDMDNSRPIPIRNVVEDDSDNSSLFSDTTVVPEALFPTMKQETIPENVNDTDELFESKEEIVKEEESESSKPIDDGMAYQFAESDVTAGDSELIFPTVGELKRSDTKEKDGELKSSKSSRGRNGSREFAVSRALGKYRQRQSSSTHSDDQSGSEEAMRASSSGSDSGSRPPSNHLVLSPQPYLELQASPVERPPSAPSAITIGSESRDTTLEVVAVSDALKMSESSSVDKNMNMNIKQSTPTPASSKFDMVLNKNILNQTPLDDNMPPTVNFPKSGQVAISSDDSLPSTKDFKLTPSPCDNLRSPGQAQNKLTSITLSSLSNLPQPSLSDNEQYKTDSDFDFSYNKLKNLDTPAPTNESVFEEEDDKSSYFEPPPLLTQQILNKINISISGEAGDSDTSVNEPCGLEGVGRVRDFAHRSPTADFGKERLNIHPQRTLSEEEDNRSVRSFRSSRVSSRRQSTEDSIDSDDEWYRYELRKLELMENDQWKEPEPFEYYPMLPDDTVKQKMSVVLCELQSKVPWVAPSIPFSEKPLEVAVPHFVSSIVVKQTVPNVVEETPQGKTPSPPTVSRLRLGSEEGSSGETSGPDSPEEDLYDEDIKTSSRRSSRKSTGSLRIQERLPKTPSPEGKLLAHSEIQEGTEFTLKRLDTSSYSTITSQQIQREVRIPGPVLAQPKPTDYQIYVQPRPHPQPILCLPAQTEDQYQKWNSLEEQDEFVHSNEIEIKSAVIVTADKECVEAIEPERMEGLEQEGREVIELEEIQALLTGDSTERVNEATPDLALEPEPSTQVEEVEGPQKRMGPPGSKWKLVKALKEKKEEKKAEKTEDPEEKERENGE